LNRKPAKDHPSEDANGTSDKAVEQITGDVEGVTITKEKKDKSSGNGHPPRTDGKSKVTF
jgi:hypothetical protein